MIRHLLLFTALSTSVALADEASHRAAAAAILVEAGGKDMLSGAFEGMSGSVETMWRQQGVPEDLIPALHGALNDWIREDLKWEDLEPKLIDLYVREFSEEELNGILKFYRTPAGRKLAEKLPLIMAEASKIGEAFAGEKQDLLTQRVQSAIEKKQAADAAK